MNIKEAKNEIKNTVNIYLAKNEEGEYRISRERQRHIYPDEMKALHQALGKPYDDLFI